MKRTSTKERRRLFREELDRLESIGAFEWRNNLIDWEIQRLEAKIKFKETNRPLYDQLKRESREDRKRIQEQLRLHRRPWFIAYTILCNIPIRLFDFIMDVLEGIREDIVEFRHSESFRAWVKSEVRAWVRARLKPVKWILAFAVILGIVRSLVLFCLNDSVYNTEYIFGIPFMLFPDNNYELKLKFMLILVIFLILALSNIIFVAFFTLLERLILASTQIRKGPNTVGILGLAQPFADAIKLLFKELLVPKKSNSLIFILGPAIMLYLSLLSWFMLPLSFTSFIMLPTLMFLFIFLFSSMNAITVILIGWSANSKYALQGSMRSISQMISYELPFSLVLVNMVLVYGSLEIPIVVSLQIYGWGILNFLAFYLFFVSALGETNRTPFDLAEAESELVSGYNTEHGSVLFTYIFLAEYCYIVIISNVMVILFFGGWLPILGLNLLPCYNYGLKLFFCLFLFVWVRATLPRYRYDQLMYLGWTILLPMSIASLLLDFFFLFIIGGFNNIEIGAW